MFSEREVLREKERVLIQPLSRFDQFPALIAYVNDAKEVPPLIECARSTGVKAVPRNGGHQLSPPISYPF